MNRDPKSRAANRSDGAFERGLPATLLGRFTPVRLISPGPLFVTLLATRVRDGASAVVKLVGRRDGPREAAAMLAREAEILAALAGRGAPELLEHEDGVLVMRDVGMPTLADAGRASLDAASATGAAGALFAALAALHDAADARGPLCVVHGDVTPANAFVAPDGSRALLADLGLASWREGSPPADGAFRGSLLYCAPEIARGEAATVRADLFALAASILHVATGVEPRAHASEGEGRGASAAALLASAAERPVDAYDALAPARRAALGPHVFDALHACLAFDPRARPARAADLLVLIPLA